MIGRILGWYDFERADEPQKGRVELTVGEVSANAHATAGAVGIVRCPRSVGDIEVSVGIEGERVFEVGFVVVCCVGILFGVNRSVRFSQGDVV
jgi:hypothetical protein